MAQSALSKVKGLKLNLPRLARAILSTSSDAIIAADGAGIITFWNPGAERVFGYISSEATGQSLDIIIIIPLPTRSVDVTARFEEMQA